MSEKNITKFKFDPNNPPRGKTDWEKVNAMSDEEINAAALSDPDAQPLTNDELNQFQRVPDTKAIRNKLSLTQEEFANTFHLSLGAVRDWEQKRYQPDQAARTLLRVIAGNPEAVKRALEQKA